MVSRGGSLSSLPFGWVVWEIDDEIWSPAASHLVLTVFRPDIMGSLDVATSPASVACSIPVPTEVAGRSVARAEDTANKADSSAVLLLVDALLGSVWRVLGSLPGGIGNFFRHFHFLFTHFVL